MLRRYTGVRGVKAGHGPTDSGVCGVCVVSQTRREWGLAVSRFGKPTYASMCLRCARCVALKVWCRV